MITKRNFASCLALPPSFYDLSSSSFFCLNKCFMVNVNGEILDQLEDEEYKLLSVLCNYGKKSCPNNDLLLKRCGWNKNVGRLRKAKKGLEKKGYILINTRFVINEDGKSVRGSNEYVITSKLINKFRGKETNFGNIELINFQQFNSEQLNFQQLKSEQFNSEQFKSELVQKPTGNKVLKVISIEVYKLLNKSKSIEVEKKEKKILSLQKKIERLEKQNLELKNKKEKEKKEVPAEKKESRFPSQEAPKKYDKRDKRLNKHLPFDILATKKTLDYVYPTLDLIAKKHKEITGRDISEEFIKEQKQSFIEKAITNYQKYKYINSVDLLISKFYGWLLMGEKHQNNNKNARNNQNKYGNSSSNSEENIFTALEKSLNDNEFEPSEASTDFDFPTQEY